MESVKVKPVAKVRIGNLPAILCCVPHRENCSAAQKLPEMIGLQRELDLARREAFIELDTIGQPGPGRRKTLYVPDQ